MDVDITKPDTGFRSVTRPHTRTPSRRSSGAPTPDPNDSEVATYVKPVSEGEGGEDMEIAPARDEGARNRHCECTSRGRDRIPEKHLKEREQLPRLSRALSTERLPEIPALPTTPAPRPLSRARTLSIDLLVPASAFDERFKDRLRAVNRTREEEDANTEQTSPRGNQNGDDRVLMCEWQAPAGKRIAIPVRIKPKVYSAEWTFLVHVLLFLSHFT